MELRQLEYFLAVCNTRNFTKASEILHVAQPSVTKSIQRLEEELHAELFNRALKPIGLTEAGEYFYIQISSIMDKLKHTVQEVEKITREKQELVRIGIPPMIGTQLLPFLVSDFPDRPAGAVLNLIELNCQTIYEKLVKDELDLGWIMDWKKQTDLSFLPIEEQEWYCILHPDNPLTSKNQLEFSDLREENFILNLLGATTTTVNMIQELCLNAGFFPSCQLSNLQYAPHPTLQIHWVRQGLGITFLPQYAANSIQDLAVRQITPPVTSRIGLAWKSDKKLSLIQKQIIASIQTEYPLYADNSHKE